MPHPHRLRASLACLLGMPGLLTGMAAAQTSVPAEPEELTTARNTLFRQALVDSQRVTEQFIAALAARETALAAAGDYEEARRFQQRREQLTAVHAGSALSLADSRAVPLSPSVARLTGSVQSGTDILAGWRSAGSGAEWAQFRLPPGRYTLEFEAVMAEAPGTFASARLQPQDKAVFEFGEVTLLPGNGNRVRFEIQRGGDESAFVPVSAGPLTFTRSPLTLRLSAAEGYPANIIRLRNLRLVPVPETTAPLSAAPSPVMDAAEALEEARDTLAEELRSAQEAVRQAYLDRLEDLAGTKPALKALIAAETARIGRSTGRDSEKLWFSPPTMPANASAGLDDFEVLLDARLAEGEPAAGDRFDIVHDGRTLPVRLLWLACPPAGGDDEAAAPLAKHFGIDIEDALDVGRAAREFTAGYLRGRPLRLLARPVREGEDALEALVFVPEVGLYQNVLIEQGLGAVQPPVTMPDSPQTRALLDSLTAREQQARKRKPPAGAWALAQDTNGKR